MKKITFILMLILLGLASGCTYDAGDDLNESDNGSNSNGNSSVNPSINNSDNSSENVSYPVNGNNQFLSAVGVRNDIEIVSRDVNYHDNVSGYLARPLDDGSYPGVVMIHEWWGLNENIKNMADVLASEGYVVLAVDLYNGRVAQDSSLAREYVSSINSTEAIENLNAAVEYLREEEDVRNVASLGWCFGGGQSAQLSASGADIDATIIYYGSLPQNSSEVSEMKGPVLGVFGSEDTSIPTEDVERFEELLNEADIDNEIYIYEGVGHAFANPSGANFAENETKAAWNRTLDFLFENLN